MRKQLLLLLFSVIAMTGYARIVTGVVTQKSDGETVIGASVQVKGTNRGTATDIDGNFAIRVPRGSKLKISYVGYESQEYKVKATTDDEGVVIALKPKEGCLGEVVVVGGVQSFHNMPAVDADIYLPDRPRR